MKQWVLFSDKSHVMQAGGNLLASIILLILMLQAGFGKIYDIEVMVWTWAAVHVFPAIILINAGRWLNTVPAKVLSCSIWRGVLALVLGYLLMVLLTILAEEKALSLGQAEWVTLEQYLYRSYAWLMPLNILVIIALYLLFFHRSAFSKINSGMLKAIASRKAEQNRSNGGESRAQLLDMIASDDLSGALESLKIHFNETRQQEALNEVLVLSHELHQTRQAEDINLIPFSEASRAINRITLALIRLTDQLP